MINLEFPSFSDHNIRPNLHISFYLFPQGTKYRKIGLETQIIKYIIP